MATDKGEEMNTQTHLFSFVASGFVLVFILIGMYFDLKGNRK